MLNVDSINPDPQLSTALAIYFARLTLPVWQQKYPEDSRPERAIEAAEKALFVADISLCRDAAVADAARTAGYASSQAASAALAAVADAARTAGYASSQAASARAANCAHCACEAAAHYFANPNSAFVRNNVLVKQYLGFTIGYASIALSLQNKIDNLLFVHHHLTQLLPLILWHKMNSKRSFGEPEKVFELLPEDCREDFLFNLDNLR